MVKQNKQEKDEFKVIQLLFFNQGKQFRAKITVPVEIPNYKVKELFNLNFVGKGKDIKFNKDAFVSLKGTYTVEELA